MLHVVTVRLENEADAAKLLELLDKWEMGGWVSGVKEPDGGFSVTSTTEEE